MINTLWRILIFLSPFICILVTGILFEVGFNNVAYAMSAVSVFWLFAYSEFDSKFGDLFLKDKE